jgi:hypothetical protein
MRKFEKATLMALLPVTFLGAGAKNYTIGEGVGVEGAIVGCTTRSELFESRTAEDFARATMSMRLSTVSSRGGVSCSIS